MLHSSGCPNTRFGDRATDGLRMLDQIRTKHPNVRVVALADFS